MKLRYGRWVAALVACFPLVLWAGGAGPGAAEDASAVKGPRLGAIRVDPRTRSFEVPGTLVRLEPPLEFLAASKGGMKLYETLLELDTDAVPFNAACLLIGLAPKQGRAPRFHFDAHPVEGTAVDVLVAWRDASGRRIEVPAERLLSVQGRPVREGGWVYTGSAFAPDGRYLAQMDGTLVGFVHDPASVIEHSRGIGVGAYGDVGANTALAPPIGSRVELIVRNLAPPPSKAAGSATRE